MSLEGFNLDSPFDPADFEFPDRNPERIERAKKSIQLTPEISNLLVTKEEAARIHGFPNARISYEGRLGYLRNRGIIGDDVALAHLIFDELDGPSGVEPLDIVAVEVFVNNTQGLVWVDGGAEAHLTAHDRLDFEKMKPFAKPIQDLDQILEALNTNFGTSLMRALDKRDSKQPGL